MSNLDERIKLAVEIAERNGRCGAVEYRDTQVTICLLRAKHSTPHKCERVESIVPF